jgi:two-component system, NtrC family, C4-dicarboxylate transport sensor histidine kinase DctB
MTQTTSFVGGNFAFRPYFSDALAGGLGRFFALGTTSLKRGYYFGAPIDIGTGVGGVVVVKVDIDEIEESWHGGDYEIIVTDPEGIIFMSGRADWLFSSILPLDADRLARTHETRRYASAELRDLPITRDSIEDGREIFTVADSARGGEYLVLSEEMAEAGWTVKVLLDTASARAQALNVVVLAVLTVGLAALSTIMYLESRTRLRERRQLEREAHERLELRVEERTAELAAVNARLEAEIGERRAAEDTLRKAQADLVQAGKLAALGQMSAALSHEFNQPLAAARNYAENALVFVDRGRVDDARANITRISALIHRMASISKHLRNFARRPNQRLGPVDLDQVVSETLEIIGWRLKAEDVSVHVDLGPKPIAVLGGPVRLEQVLVNIISNALDAVSEAKDKRIELHARRSGEQVAITIRDHGPGVPIGLGERIFDPFFSTKGIGKGLGLGLSISYNIIKDFGGTLTAENHPGGGAVFTITLKAAPAVSSARAAAEVATQ